MLRRIAEAHGVTPRQVALRFLLQRPALFTIPKAGQPVHAEDNAAAGVLKLDAPELAEIDRAFPLGPPPASLPVL